MSHGIRRYTGMLFWYNQTWLAILCGAEGFDITWRAPRVSNTPTMEAIINNIEWGWYFITPSRAIRVAAIQDSFK